MSCQLFGEGRSIKGSIPSSLGDKYSHNLVPLACYYYLKEQMVRQVPNCCINFVLYYVMLHAKGKRKKKKRN